MLISGLLGNETAEKVLLYMENYESTYARAIATGFSIPVSQVQRQLERFEREGLLSSRLMGRTRIYEFNPRYAFRDEVRAILKKTLRLLPEELRGKYFRERTRPRRQGKPL